jgi:histidine triad (HIT) family protein
MSDCIFCKIAEGEIPSSCLWDEEGVFAFRDINPQAPVHFLVIPKEHITGVSGINAENSAIVAKCFEVIAKLAEREGLGNGYRSFPTVARTPDRPSRISIPRLAGKKMAERMV